MASGHLDRVLPTVEDVRLHTVTPPWKLLWHIVGTAREALCDYDGPAAAIDVSPRSWSRNDDKRCLLTRSPR